MESSKPHPQQLAIPPGYYIVTLRVHNSKRYAAFVTLHQIGRGVFAKCDVLEQPGAENQVAEKDFTLSGYIYRAGTRFNLKGKPAFTKWINLQDIHALHAVSHEMALEMADHLRPRTILPLTPPSGPAPKKEATA